MSKVFGQNLRAKRNEMGMTIARCATEFGITAAAWNFLELGSREPKFDVLQAICNRFSCSTDELLGLPKRGNSAPTVIGNGNAVGNGATVNTLTIAAPGESSSCRKCPYKAAVKKLQKAGLQVPGIPADK